ncbi:MAG TPA: DNA integration/recombination/inversion protein, partial [Polyangiaceae bacterium]|nr:DNA integration/recombination/inversion protein [Polyangiaceae bacterium]
DLRATFVTMSLAAGKTEAWVTDRTGHTSSTMLYRYKRAARTHAEAQMGSLRPLHEIIPELSQVTPPQADEA